MRPHRRQPTRLLCPWDSPGKNTGVGCHFLLQCRKVKSESEVTQLCPTLSDPLDCSLPGSSVHGIFQARVLEWGAIAFSRYSDSFREIPGEVAGGENQSRCSRAHFDQGPWDVTSRTPKWFWTSGCCPRVSGVMAHYTQSDDQESLAQLQRKQLVKSHALFPSSSVSQKGKSSFAIRRNHK